MAPALTRPVRARAAVAAAFLALALSGCAGTPDAVSEPTPAETATATITPATPADDASATALPPSTAPTEESPDTSGDADDAAGDQSTGPLIDGRWCATPESADPGECFEVTFPTVTFDAGFVEQLTETNAEGNCVHYIVPDAPLGLLCPAGEPIDLPPYYPGIDLPDVDRIWSQQSGNLYLRA